MAAFDSKPPAIALVPDGVPRLLWSVMIPTFNCAKYLQQTLESVLMQDPGPAQMQIEVVDDCSTKDDPEAVVTNIGKGRVLFHRKPKNEGAICNFNTCIARSRGQLVHILHGDDYVLPGFYQKLGAAAENHRDRAFFGCRSFVIDEESIITSVSARVQELEGDARAVGSFFYGSPILTPAIVLRRSFYERHGGFLLNLLHCADTEMWARAVGVEGGWMTPEVLSCYRTFAANDTGRLARTAENCRDTERMCQVFAERYPGFDNREAMARICDRALRQARLFSKNGDRDAFKANLDYWRKNAPTSLRFLRFVEDYAKRLVAH